MQFDQLKRAALIRSPSPVHASGASDLVLRNVNTDGLQVYNIAHNQVTGTAFLGNVGLDWQFAGVAQVHDATFGR
jgi:hypothetical protein